MTERLTHTHCAPELPRGLGKTQIAGAHISVSDSVVQEFAFLKSFQVTLMLLVPEAHEARFKNLLWLKKETGPKWNHLC